ncbi:MAG: tetratricopeptide repeat protein [Desulfobacterales bacterium]|nr:tetratricopeptide repeat protein [Desulfobacterales bacterium]
MEVNFEEKIDPVDKNQDNNRRINKSNSFQLSEKWQVRHGQKYAFVFVALFVLLGIIYANSFQGQWQYDDFPNIVQNKNVRLKSLSWEDMANSIHLSPGRISRPLAYLSFAVNHYFGGLDVFGYHLVNLAIHYIAAIFLFLFIYNTLKLPLIKDRYRGSAYAVSLLAVFFWASSPLHVNAVTYIVQRMTSMSGMAYIMAMYFYVKGRTDSSPMKKKVMFTLCAGSAAMSFASKEIAAMLPVSLFLYDLLLLKGWRGETLRQNTKILSALFVLLLLFLGAYIYLGANDKSFNYSGWPFSLTERLLTEPRVFLFYISLLLYPVSSRLTMDHDMDISRSLTAPFSTLAAILILLFIIVVSLSLVRKRPLISFCVLFFFLNHLIEGSFLPLDLIFEHRNYVPSMLIFVPLAILLLHVLDYFSYNKKIQMTFVSVIVFMMAAQGHTVAMRNQVFGYQELLWMDNIAKTPRLSRPHAALASAYFNEGDYPKALKEIKEALALSRYPNMMQAAKFIAFLGNYYLMIEGSPDKALSYFEAALKIVPEMAPALNGVAMVQLSKGKWGLARETVRKAILLEPGNASFYSNLALILLKEGKFEDAVQAARKAITLQDGFAVPFAMLAQAYWKQERISLAISYWEKYLSHVPRDIHAHFALIELYHRIGDKARLITTAGRLFYLNTEKDMGHLVDKLSEKQNFLGYRADKNVLLPILQEAFRDIK